MAGSKARYAAKGLPDDRRIVVRSIRSGTDGTLLVLDIFSARLLLFDRGGNFLRQLPFPARYGAIADMTMDEQGNIYLLGQCCGGGLGRPERNPNGLNR